MCQNDNCKQIIDHMYNNIVESINHASLIFLWKNRKDKFTKFFSWNCTVKRNIKGGSDLWKDA